mmetsp:Transcript_23755/g.60608  ORF Transcript_23755/g.60608 Transcript_23755/m.60608 type:complete len:93 (+) Transcript_23755:16-294(+)
MRLLYSNRSAAWLVLGGAAVQDALPDARACISLRPDWPKWHYRQGAALEALGQKAEAMAAYIRAQDPEPSNADTNAKVKALRSQDIKPQVGR